MANAYYGSHYLLVHVGVSRTVTAAQQPRDDGCGYIITLLGRGGARTRGGFDSFRFDSVKVIRTVCYEYK